MPRTGPSNSLLAASESNTLVTITTRDAVILRYAESHFNDGASNFLNQLTGVGELKQSGSPETDRVNVEISDTAGTLGIRVASQLRTLEMADVLIQKFYAPIGNPAVYSLYHYFSGKLVSPQSIWQRGETFKKALSFDVITKEAAAGISMADRTMSPACAWLFKHPWTCGYIGPLTTCNNQQKSNFGCVRRGRLAQNGGWTSPETPSDSPPTGGAIGGNTCFTADTQIATPNKFRKISEFAVGDYVTAFDENTLEVGSKKVTDVLRHTADGFYRFNLADGTVLEVTPEHMFFTTDGWIPADHIIFNVTEIYTTSFGTMKILGGGFFSEEREVFNLDVEDFHTYFAGGLAVHNPKYPPDL